MARAKKTTRADTADPGADEGADPGTPGEGAKFLLEALLAAGVKAVREQLLPALDKLGVDLKTAAREAVRAEVVAQVRTEVEEQVRAEADGAAE